MPTPETTSLARERLFRRSEAKPLSIGLERPVSTLPVEASHRWPRLPLEVVVSTLLTLLSIACIAGVVLLDRPPAVTIAALPPEEAIVITRADPLKVQPVDAAMLAMVAPALEPAGTGTGSLPAGLHLTITKNPAIAEVKTASLKDMESEAKSDPADPQAQLRLGAAQAEAGNFEKAASAFARAYDLDPASARATYNLAVTLEHLGKTRQAIYYYARTMDNLGLAPGSPEATDIPVDTVRARLAYLTK